MRSLDARGSSRIDVVPGSSCASRDGTEPRRVGSSVCSETTQTTHHARRSVGTPPSSLLEPSKTPSSRLTTNPSRDVTTTRRRVTRTSTGENSRRLKPPFETAAV